MTDKIVLRDPENKDRLMDGVDPSEHIYRGNERAMRDAIQARGRDLAVKVFRILENRELLGEIFGSCKNVLPSERNVKDPAKEWGIPADIWGEAGVRKCRNFGGGLRTADIPLLGDLDNTPDSVHLGVGSEMERTILLLRETMSMIGMLTSPEKRGRSDPHTLAKYAITIREGAIKRANRDRLAE